MSLRVGIDDRVFEHGLGLFETFRTWDGHAPLLTRHLSRLRASAAALGLSLEGVELPDASAVAALLEADETGLDARVRVILTGGASGSGGAMLWMRAASLASTPTPARSAIDFGSWEVAESDPLARHKSLNYWHRRLANETAAKQGLTEILSHSANQRLWEGSRTSLFSIREGTIFTPSLVGPIVPGIFRGLVIETARKLGIGVEEPAGLSFDFLAGCSEIFLTNSVRGIVPVSRCRDLTWPAPGEITRALQATLNHRIETTIRERNDL